MKRSYLLIPVIATASIFFIGCTSKSGGSSIASSSSTSERATKLAPFGSAGIEANSRGSTPVTTTPAVEGGDVAIEAAMETMGNMDNIEPIVAGDGEVTVFPEDLVTSAGESVTEGIESGEEFVSEGFEETVGLSEDIIAEANTLPPVDVGSEWTGGEWSAPVESIGGVGEVYESVEGAYGTVEGAVDGAVESVESFGSGGFGEAYSIPGSEVISGPGAP